MIKRFGKVNIIMICEFKLTQLRALPQLTQEDDPEIRLSSLAASWFGEFSAYTYMISY